MILLHAFTLITRSEEPYRVCVCVCTCVYLIALDLVPSTTSLLWPELVCFVVEKEIISGKLTITSQ
jgi:hypothetical protein